MSGTSQLLVYETQLIYGKRQYRAPFKVDLVSWNPFAELVALASKKGDVVLKRSGWKKCWRISVANVVDPLADVDPEAQRSIECISWSPCGDILAIGMSDGHVHLVEVDHGNVRWSKLLTDPSGTPPSIKNIRWFSHNNCASGSSSKGVHSDEVKAFAQLGEEEKEWMTSCKELELLYNTKLRGTLLFACRDDLKISVLAGGIAPVAVIDTNESLKFLELMPLQVYDVIYMEKTVSVALTSHGKRPHCGGDGNFGVPVVPRDKDLPPTVHTHVVNFPLHFRDENAMWQMVDRYVRLFSRYINVVETMNSIVKDWATQKQIFINRLTPTAKNFDLGTNLISFCVSGGGNALGDAYVEKTLAAGLNGMREFLETFFNNVLIGLRGAFSDSVRSMVFHLEQFKTRLQQLSSKESFDPDAILFPTRNFDVRVYPFESRIVKNPDADEFSSKIKSLSESIEKLAVSFQKTAILATQASIRSLKELLLFVRWISIFPQLIKNNKKGQVAMGQSGKVEVRPLLEYLIDTFVETEDEKKTFRRNCFDIDEIVAIQTEFEKNVLQPRPKDTPFVKMEAEDDEVYGVDPSSSTPVARRKMNDNKGNKETKEELFWHPKMDKVSEIWASPGEFSDELMKMLGPPLPSLKSGEFQLETPNIALQIKSLKNLMRQADGVMEFMCVVKSPDWLCELASDADHRGFNGVQLSHMVWYNNAVSTPFIDSFGKQEREVLRAAICVALFDEKRGQYRVILPKNSGHRFSGLQEDLGADIDVGCKMIQFTDENEENIAEPGTLTVDIPKDEYGEIIRIHDVKIQLEGFFFALVTTKSETQGELRRFLRGHPILKNEFHVHSAPFRHDQFESMAFMPANMFASIVSDEATRLSTFSTNPLEETNTEEKAKEAEEYRRYAAERDRASRPPEPAFFHIYDGNKVLRVQADE